MGIQTKGRGQLRSLQAGRGLAAIAVVIHHAAFATEQFVAPLPRWLSAIFHQGLLGVVEGDIVEFGTCTGLTARMIARAMIASERDRSPKRLHLFDSFEGHPEITSEVDRNSYEVRAGIWRQGFPRLLTRDELFQSCARILPVERVLTYEGWFTHTNQQLSPDQKFAFIHFHADLYQSAIDAIGGLLERAAVSNGALVCFSGYNTGQASPERGERGAWKELTDRYQIKFSQWRAYGNLGNSFFIHDYQRT